MNALNDSITYMFRKKIHFSIFLSFNVSAQLYFTAPADLADAVNRMIK